MGLKTLSKAALILVVLTAAAAPVHAVSLAFQVVQLEEQKEADLHSSIADDDKSEPKTRTSSYELEEALFEVFFECGVIASNSPAVVARTQKQARSVFASSLKAATRGGFSVFVELTSDCAESLPAWRGGVKSVSWRVVNVKTKKVLGSGQRDLKKASLAKEKRSSVYVLGLEIADEIYKTIRK